MNRWIPAGVALVVVLAGCMAPSAAPSSPATPDATGEGTPAGTEGPTPTPTPADGTGTATPVDPATPTRTPTPADPTPTPDGETAIEVRGGSLPVDANATFERLTGVLDSNASSPGYVVALTERALPNASGGGTASPGRSFRAALGVVPEPNATGSLAYRYPAMTSSVGVASVYPGEKPPGLVETILAHELVHYVQFREGYAAELRRSLPVGTTDGSFAYRSVLEGTAVYATDAYVRRHVPSVDSNSALYGRIRNVTPPGTPGRYGNSWYAFGADYAAARLDSPAGIERLVDAPPRTSEQVIHGYAPGVEPPRPLSVTVADGDWDVIGTDRKGEALLRIALQNGLPVSAADRVAAGWGNDSLVTLRSGDGVGYAWTIRWDDRANATAFVEGFETYLDNRGNRSGGVWSVGRNAFELVRVSPETTAVLVGNRSFVSGTTVSGTNESVTVRPPGSGSGGASEAVARSAASRSGRAPDAAPTVSRRRPGPVRPR